MNAESNLWKSIEDLPINWPDMRNSQVEALIAAWHAQAEQMRKRKSYEEFLLRLRRQWAIETGVLERLYALSDGVTKTLIEKGFDSALIGYNDTDQNPTDVMAIIRDQFTVVEGLQQFISGQRPFGTSYIKELHRALTEHQMHYEAHDTLGQQVRRALPKGEWKRLPNDVTGPGGFVFQFCPPEHVASEVDCLVETHDRHEQWEVPSYIEAAWLHHRFTLIHPFTDGNGRVARCLATLVFLKAEWFPLVITRSDRDEYIAALRQADKGDLRRLVEFFTSLQGKAIREAFSLSEELHYEQVAVGSILSAVKSKFSRQRMELLTKKQQVLATADSLHALTVQKLGDVAEEIRETIEHEEKEFAAYCTHASHKQDKANYHYFQIIQCARSLGYFANLEVYQAWANLAIRTNTRAEVLFSFHGMGKESTGVIVCSAMFYTKQTTDTGETAIGEVVPLCPEPFTLTYEENPTEVERRFRTWMDDRLILGLDRWRKGLGA